MSKIALFQEVAKGVFRLHEDPAFAALFDNADRAHMNWQIEGGGFWACSDQFVNGQAKGSRYYPRIITTALWLSTDARLGYPDTAVPSEAETSKPQVQVKLATKKRPVARI